MAKPLNTVDSTTLSSPKISLFLLHQPEINNHTDNNFGQFGPGGRIKKRCFDLSKNVDIPQNVEVKNRKLFPAKAIEEMQNRFLKFSINVLKHCHLMTYRA